MNALTRHFTDIKVTSSGFSCADHKHGKGQHRIIIEWLDEVGEPQSVMYYGYSADRLHADLERHTAIGEQSRADYLLGLLRGLALERRGG